MAEQERQAEIEALREVVQLRTPWRLRPQLERLLARLEAGVLPLAERCRVPQTPETGLGAIADKWPGEETDEQIAEGLAELRGKAAPAEPAVRLSEALAVVEEVRDTCGTRWVWRTACNEVIEHLTALAGGGQGE